MTPTEIICTAIAPILGGNGIVTWWLQHRLEHRLRKEMVEHESAITHGYDTQIEALRSQLSQSNFRFSEVFKTTEKTIAELYALLLPILDSAEDSTMLMSDRTPEQKLEKIKEFSKRCNAFYEVFRPKKIYVPKETAKQLNDLMNTAIHMVRTFNRSEQLLKIRPLSKDSQEVLEKMDNQVESLQQKLQPLLTKLESEFQDILGFPKDDKK